MRARDQCSIFSTGGKFCPDYGLLLDLHALYSSCPFLCTLACFQMAIAHECPLAAMCMAVGEEDWKEVAVGSLILWGPKLDEIVGKSYQMTEMVGNSL